MTTEESFAALETVKAEKNPYELTREEWHSFSTEQKEERYKLQRQWDNEHEARLVQAIHNLVPKEGLLSRNARLGSRRSLRAQSGSRRQSRPSPQL